MKEIFKAIPGFEGVYEVSDLGRVKSLSREIKYKNRTAISKERIFKPGVDVHGYLTVSLRKDSKTEHKRVHQLVAMAFLNHTPCRYKLVVDHIDNNPSNNRLENLQLITNRENTSKDRKNKTSNFTGVCWDKRNNKWKAAIHINKKRIHLGQSYSEDIAKKMYDDFCIKNNIINKYSKC